MQLRHCLQLKLLIALVLASAFPASLCGQDEDPEVQLLRSYLEQPAQAQLGTVAALKSQADRTVAPYMKNPALTGRREQAVGPGDGYSTSVLGAEFTFDTAGRHELRREAGQVRSELHQFRVRELLLQQVCVVRAAVLELDYAQQRLSALERVGERYRWLLATVETLAAGKEKSKFDVRRVALTLTAHDEKVKELSAGRAAIREKLGTIAKGAVADDLQSGIKTTLPELGGVLEASRKRHPAMGAAHVLGKAAGLEERAAGKEWIPDLGLYGGYRVDTFDSGQQPLHGYELGFTIDLPLFRKGAEKEARARASSAAIRLRLDRIWDTIRVRVTTAHSSATSRLHLLAELAGEPGEEAQAVWAEGVRAYRLGVVVLGELVELLQAEEERALARERIRHQARRQVLEMYCAAGYFPEPAMDDLISGDSK